MVKKKVVRRTKRRKKESKPGRPSGPELLKRVPVVPDDHLAAADRKRLDRMLPDTPDEASI